MPKFAIIDGNTVINVILAESQEIAEEVTGLKAIEHGEAVIGAIYDPETNSFSVISEPTAEEPASAD